MKRKYVSTRALALSYKPLVARVMVVVLIGISLGLIAASRLHESFAEKTRMAIADTVMPVIHALARPGDTLAAAESWIHEMTTLRDENERLKAENARLLQWQAAASELQSENEKLRKLMRFAPPGKPAYTSARIMADTNSPYARSAIIGSGEDQGVAEDMAVITDSGLVGRVVEVGEKTARVLLLTDINSRIPVVSETSRERAIAGGTGADTLSLLYLSDNSKIAVGEKIVTSGDGGVLPPGLPVGTVVRIEKGVPVVRPSVDWYHLEYVSVVNFSM